MPRTRACSAAAAWTERSTARRGRRYWRECRRIGGCPTGEARITSGYRLRARHVIHTVGPVWRGGDKCEPELLASCYRSCFALVERNGLRSVAFPAISCGIYGYPVEEAAAIAVAETRAALDRIDARVTFALVNGDVRLAYRRLLP